MAGALWSLGALLQLLLIGEVQLPQPEEPPADGHAPAPAPPTSERQAALADTGADGVPQQSKAEPSDALFLPTHKGWAAVSKQAMCLVDRLLQPNKDDRISLQSCADHPWLTVVLSSTEPLTGAHAHLCDWHAEFTYRELCHTLQEL